MKLCMTEPTDVITYFHSSCNYILGVRSNVWYYFYMKNNNNIFSAVPALLDIYGVISSRYQAQTEEEIVENKLGKINGLMC